MVEEELQAEPDSYDKYDTSNNRDSSYYGLDPSQPQEQSPDDDGGATQPNGTEETPVFDVTLEQQEPPPPPSPPPPPPTDTDGQQAETGTQAQVDSENLPRATVVYRAGWGARPPKEPPAPPLRHPIDSVIFLHTGTRVKECHDSLECAQVLQDLQAKNMFEDGMPDIQYNFMITSDSTIYEGRGWFHNATKDPDYKHYDGKSLDIGFIGDFSGRDPPENMLNAAMALIGEGIGRQYLERKINVCPVGSTIAVPVDFADYMQFLLDS